MSKKELPEFKTYDQYMEESGREPFPFPRKDDEPLEIEQPTGGAMLRAAEMYRETADDVSILEVVSGEQWKQVRKELDTMPHLMMQEVITDMLVYFEITPTRTLKGPKGRIVRERDPRKIEDYMEKGFQPLGEQ